MQELPSVRNQWIDELRKSPLQGFPMTTGTDPEITPTQLAEAELIGGYSQDNSVRKWPIGSAWGSECVWLYRKVREIKPKIVIEIGCQNGCSTSHIALALKHNGGGKVFSIDNGQQIGDETGKMIPEELSAWFKLIRMDAFDFDLKRFLSGRKIDLLVEDGQHTTGFTKRILEIFLARNVIIHDVEHFDAGKRVKPEAISVLGEPTEIFFEPPADCGYGLWKISQ
jgi:hypothetical protein